MNQRIRELIEQAMETVDVSEKLGMPGTDLVFNKEKFAVLLIQKCVDQVSLGQGIGILEHFGLEYDLEYDEEIEE